MWDYSFIFSNRANRGLDQQVTGAFFFSDQFRKSSPFFWDLVRLHRFSRTRSLLGQARQFGKWNCAKWKDQGG